MDSDDPQQPAVGESAGKQLRRAREKLGLSIKDIADVQHLRVSIIQAIEDGDYEQIDTELFLKGYVRGYAEQVGTDANALIECLDVELEPLREQRAKQEEQNPLVDIERRRRKKRQVAKALLVIALLGGIVFAAWKLVLEPRMATDVSGGLPASGSVDEADAGAGSPESPDVAASADLTAAGAGEAESGGGLEFAESTEVTDGIEVSTVTDANERNEIEQTTNPAVNPEVADSTGAPSESTVAVANEVETVGAPESSVAAQAELEMSFVANCWVQVTDAVGNQLVASLQRAGDEFSVSGVAPLKVVIGAVDAVGTMRFAGETVDMSRSRVTNNRTELTLTL